MTVVVRFTRREEARALPILLRHSPGMVLADRTYVLHGEVIEALRTAGVKFIEVGRETNLPQAAEQLPVKEYDIFIPLYYNDGTPIEPVKFQRLQAELIEHFEGLTFFPQPNEGFWRMGDVMYRDEIVIYRVLARRAGAARRFLSQLKEQLKRDLKQEEILIVERDIETL